MWGLACAPGIQLTAGKIDLLFAAATGMLSVELVREYLLFLATVRALAQKGAKILEVLESRTVSGCGHDFTSGLRYSFRLIV